MHDRRTLLEGLFRAIMRATGQSILFSDAIAEKVGINSTDLECLGFLFDEGSATAGRLAEVTGLTTGAATRMVDRLEKAGYVRRIADPADRRRVIVEPIPERMATLQPYYGSLMSAVTTALESYSDDQLELIVGFFQMTEGLMQGEIRKVKEQPAEGEPPREFSGPLGDVTEARLEFVSGVSHARLIAGAPDDELYHARIQGPRPRIRSQDGFVSVEYPRLSMADWARFALFDRNHPAAEIALSSVVPWDIACIGGASSLAADLAGLQLGSLSISGGASQLELHLGVPKGTALLRIDDGASKVTIRRPSQVPVRVQVRGGSSHVELDGERGGPSGEGLTLETAGYDHAVDRYEVVVGGGATHLTIERA
ncbi:MAG TPA: MarR family transcriptional regulator [Tepidiformaceae bacterium]|nr:MarR family transcriptional regulator [Tepidiformaceae bacterium]